MAPQRWRAGRGIRLNPRGRGACSYPQRNVRILRLLESGVPDPRVQTPRESKWLSPHRSQWARVTLI